MIPSDRRMLAGRKTRRAALAVGVLLWLACGGRVLLPTDSASTKPSAAATSRPISDGGPLLDLADQALELGELDVARSRYERLIRMNPNSALAHVGLARVALIEGRRSDAIESLDRAVEISPSLVEAWVALADASLEIQDDQAARDALERALALEGSHVGAHERVRALTGRASGRVPDGLEPAIAWARQYPYDPRVRMIAGRELAAVGRDDEASDQLRTALWLADLNPRAAHAAAGLLSEVDPTWSSRTFVPVVVRADEIVRKDPGWKFRIRALWLDASIQLAEILDVWFVLVAIEPVRLAGAASDLNSIHSDCLDPSTRRSGMLYACFTGRAANRSGVRMAGLAEFLGDDLTVRLEPDEMQSRVLLHELLHIYGAIHVADDVESLMNPAGGALRLDAANYAIVTEMRTRGFETGNLATDVIDRIDVESAIEAYRVGIRLNFALRRLGAAEAMEQVPNSRYVARKKWIEATRLDPHLADVSRVVAQMMVSQGRGAEALHLIEIAASLYGTNTPRGKRMMRWADGLESQLERAYGLERP